MLESIDLPTNYGGDSIDNAVALGFLSTVEAVALDSARFIPNDCTDVPF